MGKLSFGNSDYEYLWVTDVAFGGVRLEINDLEGAFWFDVSVSDAGLVTVNTFSKEVPAELISAALELAQQRH